MPAERGVIQHPGFEVDPWLVCERSLDLECLAQTESLFALSNGHLGLRGNLDEGEPSGQAGTYLASFYETRPLPYAEPGYGDPEDGQTVVNVTARPPQIARPPVEAWKLEDALPRRLIGIPPPGVAGR
jgi:hypothetical protein